MTKPIQNSVEKINFDAKSRKIYCVDDIFVVDEPKLTAKHVEWQPGSSFYMNEEQKVFELPKITEKTPFDGSLTVFLLLCGHHDNIQRECLKEIVKTRALQHIVLRVAAVSVSENIKKMLESAQVDKMYWYDEPCGKYKIMRDMFWDSSAPIVTEYITWFDDNAFIRDSSWVIKLRKEIKSQKLNNVVMFGSRMVYKPDARVFSNFKKWSEGGNWYRNALWQTESGGVAPNGDCVHYCSGWFFTLRTDALRICDIPDSRLVHKYGDIAVGAQLHQNGYLIKDFNSNKKLVYTPAGNQGVQRVKPNHLPW